MRSFHFHHKQRNIFWGWFWQRGPREMHETSEILTNARWFPRAKPSLMMNSPLGHTWRGLHRCQSWNNQQDHSWMVTPVGYWARRVKWDQKPQTPRNKHHNGEKKYMSTVLSPDRKGGWDSFYIFFPLWMTDISPSIKRFPFIPCKWGQRATGNLDVQGWIQPLFQT